MNEAQQCISERRFTDVLIARALAARKHSELPASLAPHEDAQMEITRELKEERSQRMLIEATVKQLREALAFAEAATYEAHHRAKNSLQIAAGLLSMHARATTTAEVGQSLDEARSRLMVLSHVHELLYRDSSVERDTEMSTLLEAVADALRGSFAQRSGQIVLTVASQSLRLAPERAVPLALLANEVVTNAYKHAFPNITGGAIHVRLTCAADELVLQIADDGVGMTERASHATMGMRLVRIFAAQLGGILDVAVAPGSSGTSITLTAPRFAASPRTG